MDTRRCGYTVPGSRIGPTCPALAAPGSPFCLAHRALKQGVGAARAAVPADPDADVLPWQAADEAIFHDAELRRARDVRSGRRSDSNDGRRAVRGAPAVAADRVRRVMDGSDTGVSIKRVTYDSGEAVIHRDTDGDEPELGRPYRVRRADVA